MNRVCIGLFVAGLALGSGISYAAPIYYGGFSIGGSITVSGNAISWVDFSDTPNLYVVGPPPPSGAFSAVALSTEGTIHDLSLSSEPVGMPFYDPGWLTLPAPDATLSITLTYIFPGTEGTTDCAATPAANQVCTPLDAANTAGPFNLVNNANATESTAYFTFAGFVTDGNPANDTPITGQFSANFNTPYQDVLSTLATGPNFSVTNTYAGTFTAAPEPSGAILVLLGGFMVGASLLAKRKIAKG